MPDQPSASQQITTAVCAWEGVSSGFGRRGEFAFRLAGREIGHLHGDHAAHFFFSPADWERLHDAGRIDFHPVFPDRHGPAARRITGAADVADVIAMMRLNYDRIQVRQAARAA